MAGARPLRRTIQREIEDNLSEKILFGELAGQIVTVDVEGTGPESIARPRPLPTGVPVRPLTGGVLIVAGVAGKLAAGYAPFWFRGNKTIIGVGMVPRGEVGLIFAQMGLATGSSMPAVRGSHAHGDRHHPDRPAVPEVSPGPAPIRSPRTTLRESKTL